MSTLHSDITKMFQHEKGREWVSGLLIQVSYLLKGTDASAPKLA